MSSATNETACLDFFGKQRHDHLPMNCSPSSFRFAVGGVLLVAATTSCSGGRSGQQERLDPPELRLLAVRDVTGGQIDEPGRELILGCEDNVIVSVGPAQANVLDNWFMRPRGNCGGLSQCGYVRAELLDAEQQVLTSSERALVDVPLDLRDVEVASVAAVRVTLVQGNDDEPFELDGKTFGDSWELSLSTDCEQAPDGAGQAGASGL